VILQTSTDQSQQSVQSSQSSTGFSLAAPSIGDVSRWINGGPNSGGVSSSAYNASRSTSDGSTLATQQTASVVSGNSVVIKSNTGDIDVVGSGISGTQSVDLIATKGVINVLAGVDTTVNHQDSSSHQIGDLGSNGTSTGFSDGVASSHSVQDAAAQTQSTMRSQIVSQSGSVSLSANQDITVRGADLAAATDLTLIGKNLNLDPGTDAVQNSASQSSSQYATSVALGGVAGNAVAMINQSMAHASQTSDPRLAALDKAQAALSLYGAEHTVGSELTDSAAAADGPALLKVTVSVGGGSSQSSSQSSSTAADGTTLKAGGTVNLVATGSGTKDASGFATAERGARH
jgi:filamentous hemagglutinin